MSTATMTIDDLHATLAADGWRFGAAHRNSGVPWYAWRNLDGAIDCACNDKPPCLLLTPFEIEINGSKWQSVEFEVCGEVGNGNQWLKLQAYSIRIDDAIGAIPRCTELLRAAWNAAATATPAAQ